MAFLTSEQYINRYLCLYCNKGRMDKDCNCDGCGALYVVDSKVAAVVHRGEFIVNPLPGINFPVSEGNYKEAVKDLLERERKKARYDYESSMDIKTPFKWIG